ncbi:MAG: hypothetical protein JOZ60_03400 [Verrucomicrobia bacterium]|nr:hypothetical protein [Verrucomicrobiota bacterium]
MLGIAFKLGPGGKGSNQAVAAARLKSEVRLITKLGRDAFGEMARNFYRQQGMSLERVYGCAVAGISVTRPGTAPSMPAREEVDALVASAKW